MARPLLTGSQPGERDVFSGPSPMQLASGFDFQSDLEASRPYRRANRDSMDFSFRSSIARSHMWSIFSDLSLGDISNLSFIALPLYADEITNSCHYAFGGHSRELPLPPLSAASGRSPRTLLRECVEVELKLSQIQAFRELFIDERIADYEHPFRVLHRVFRKGYPLLMLFNIWEQRFDCQSHFTGSTASQLISRAMSAFSSVPEFLGIDFEPYPSRIPVEYCTDFLKVGAALSPSTPPSSVLTLEQVFALIQKVLALKKEQFEPVDVDSWIDQIGESDQDPSQVESIVEFIQQERRIIDQLQKISVTKSQLSRFNVLSGNDLLTLLAPLHKLMKVELQFLLDMEMELLGPFDYQRWSGVLLDWCRFTHLYGTLIGSEPRNKKLLRSRLLGKSATWLDVPKEHAILECLELVSLPSLCLRSKVRFMEVCVVALFMIDCDIHVS